VIDLYNIKIPIFEGPFDLLLHLIKENKIDIYDIPIALITTQYLQYLEIMKELNLEIAGEFLVMAATLIHIKSKMLLPEDECLSTEEVVDPRSELVQQLIEYQRYKDAALELKRREEEWIKVFRKDSSLNIDEESGELYLFDISFFDLLKAFQKILDKSPTEIATITKEILSIKDRMSFILEIIDDKEVVRFEDIFIDGISRLKIIVTFMALLELIRIGAVKVYQERLFGNIWIVNPSKQGSIKEEVVG